MTIRENFVSLSVVAVVALFSITASAQESSQEALLIPISVHNVPGAYGTSWTTELWFRNGSNESVGLANLPTSDSVFPPGSSGELPLGDLGPEFPQFIFTRRGVADSLQFDLRLFNSADRSRAWGVKLPVVHEREFSTAISLINVPTARDYRVALRVYGFPNFGPTADDLADVRVYSSDNDVLLAEARLPINQFTKFGSILSLADEFPIIRTSDRVRVEVRSVGEGTRLWAFISVTSNSSQNVAIVTP